MSIDRVRRGIEFDAHHALRSLPRDEDGNPSAHDVGELASFHFEKFAYVCIDVHFGQIEEHLDLMSQTLLQAAKECAGGEKYYMHEEHFEEEIRSRLSAFLDGRRYATPRP